MADACRQRLGIDPVELDSGHCPHVSAPEQLARIILDPSSS